MPALTTKRVAKALKTDSKFEALTLRAIADDKGVDESTVRRAIARGDLPEPFMMRLAGGRTSPFLLRFQIEEWQPRG